MTATIAQAREFFFGLLSIRATTPLKAIMAANVVEITESAPVDGLCCSGGLKPGMVVYCQLLVRDAVKVAQAMVVKPGAWQTVVACPGECALSSSGEWIENLEQGAWQSFSCSSGDPGNPCTVVFYTVDSRALSTSAHPDAICFGPPGDERRPLPDRLLQLFHGEVEGDSLAVAVMCTTNAEEHSLYHNIPIGDRHEIISFNSVLMIPNFLTKDECYELMDSADRCAHGGSNAGRFYQYQDGMNRFPIHKLDLGAQMLSKSIINERLLGFFEQHLPQTAEDLFGQSSGLRKMRCSFSPGEPAVNRYMVGGGIAPHTDKQTLTLNVVLSDFGAFTGGGTVFWPQVTKECADGIPDEHGIDNVVVLRALQGSALLFNGKVKHAGRPVVSGVRHTFVASFNLWSMDG